MGGYQMWDVVAFDDDPQEQAQAALNILDYLPEPEPDDAEHSRLSAWIHGYLFLLSALGISEDDFNPFLAANYTSIWNYVGMEH